MKSVTKYLLFLFILNFSLSFSQIKTPTKWKIELIKKNDKDYKILINVNLEPKWHIYSQNAGKGPVSTEVVFDKNPLITFDTKSQENGNLINKFDKAFNSKLNYYENNVTFINNIKLKTKLKTKISGYVYYMVCDDSKCLPPTKEKFSLNID